jgi:hypothetical protein
MAQEQTEDRGKLLEKEADRKRSGAREEIPCSASLLY